MIIPSNDFDRQTECLPREERRRLNRLHRQGFNHQEVVDEHLRETSLATREWMEINGKNLLEHLAKLDAEIEALGQKVEAYDNNNPFELLNERVELLKSSCAVLEEQASTLTAEMCSASDALTLKRERKQQLHTTVEQMTRKLKDMKGQCAPIDSGKVLIGSALSASIAKGTRK